MKKLVAVLMFVLLVAGCSTSGVEYQTITTSLGDLSLDIEAIYELTDDETIDAFHMTTYETKDGKQIRILSEANAGYKVDESVLEDELTQVEIDIYKVPCGAAKKGEFHFEGSTDVRGYYQQDYVVNYNLRNSGDKIIVEVKATSPWAHVDLYQTLEYSYADFYDKELKYPSLYFEFLE